jgi:glycosyltransferase involved in cell wall biosynthesis
MKISVVVPLMNEEENIKYLIEKVDKALKDFNYELILVDDGSTDNTVEEIKKYMNDKTKVCQKPLLRICGRLFKEENILPVLL